MIKDAFFVWSVHWVESDGMAAVSLLWATETDAEKCKARVDAQKLGEAPAVIRKKNVYFHEGE